MKLTREQFRILFSEEFLLKGYYTEISFELDGEEAWLGKMPHPEKKEQQLYWYSLSSDGTKASCYESFHKWMYAKVFRGKTILECLDRIEWRSIEGSSFEELLPYYLKDL